MPPPALDADAAWTGIAALYAEPGAEADLLQRQDRDGLDVVLHLFVRWAAGQGHAIDAAAQREAEALVAPWREQVIVPLRRLRRAMKGWPGAAHDAHDAREAARERVRAAELAAERAQLQMLCDWLAARDASTH